MGSKRKFSVIIPVYGDNEPVDQVLSEIRSAFASDPNLEIIIVWTPSNAHQQPPTFNQNGQDYTKIVVESRRGYGRAYLTGFAHATGDIIITLDGDGTYPALQIPRLVKAFFMNDLDFLSTNRLQNYELGAFTPVNLIGNHLLSYFIRLLFGVPFKDSQSGMWIFKRKILRLLCLKETGMQFSSEIKIEAYMAGCKCGEIPIPYRRRRGGQTSLIWARDGFRILRFLLRKKILSTILPAKHRRNE